FVDRIKATEGKDDILSISIAHCFPYADVPELSGRILVVMDGDKQKGDALAARIGAEFITMRGKTRPEMFDVATGVAAGLEYNDLPVVLADPADNAGGGAPARKNALPAHLVAGGGGRRA